MKNDKKRENVKEICSIGARQHLALPHSNSIPTKGNKLMKSYLIKDTTKEERIALIRQWVPADEAMEDCDIDLWDMYRDYISGTREIAEINAAFVEE